jgi:DNA-binding CsgD family transcriptional regulator/tetratricopeptide (TPR) repeat protein
MRVLTGHAGEVERAVPFGPFLDMIDQLGDDGHEFAALAMTPAVSNLEQYRLYRRLRDGLGRGAPLVVLLDDVHWADEASLGLIDFLVRRPPYAAVTLVMSLRSGLCPPRLARALEISSSSIVRVRVPPLTSGDVGLLVPCARPSHRQLLLEASAGNPLYLSLLAAMPIGAVEAISAEELPVDDDTLRPGLDGLGVEVDGLPEMDRLVARAAAVAGARVAPDLVAVVAQLPESVVLEALDRLVERGVMSASAGMFAFAHPLLRAAAYRLSGAGWRLSAHRRAFGHLASAGAPTIVRARHLEHALRWGDVGAAEELAEAAELALATAPATSARWAALALDIVPLRAVPSEFVARLRVLLGKALLASGELERAADALHKALRESAAAAPDALVHLVRCERMRGRLASARVLLASQRINGSADVERATLDLVEGRVAQGLRRARRLVQHGDQADPTTAATVSALLALATASHGHREAAFDCLAEADTRLNALSDSQLCTILDSALPAAAWSAHLLEQHDQAMRHLERGIRVARSHRHTYALPHLYAARASVMIRLGRLEDAIDSADDAQEAGAAIGVPDVAAPAAAVKLRATLWMSGPEAVRDLTEAARALPLPAAEWTRLSVVTDLLDVEIQTGTPVTGPIAMRLGLKPRQRSDPMLATRYALAAEAALAADRTAQARYWSERAVRVAQWWALPGQLGIAQLVHARAEAADGNPSGAALDAAAAAEAFGRAEMPILQGQAHLVAAQAAEQLGNARAAGRRIADARALFTACGAHWLSRTAARDLRSLAARQPRRRVVSDELSTRELQVAELVAQGLSNRAIGERLFLSPRTVESHLSRILAKLGAPSRAAVARRLAA